MCVFFSNKNLFHSNMWHFLRGFFYYYFNAKRTSAKSHRILIELYGEHALTGRTCQKWFARFENGDFGLDDERGSGLPKKFEDVEQEAFLDVKIAAKYKKGSENLWQSLKQPFQNNQKQPDAFTNKEIRCHMN